MTAYKRRWDRHHNLVATIDLRVLLNPDTTPESVVQWLSDSIKVMVDTSGATLGKNAIDISYVACKIDDEVIDIPPAVV